MARTRPLVTVVMPAYNAQGTIDESIRSVRAQSFTDWELIVVDDASTDHTAAVVEPHQADPRVVLVRSETNVGLPAARNLGARVGTGRYVAFLDSDDLWLRAKLERQVAYHAKHPGCLVSHTGFEIFDARGPVRRSPLGVLDRWHARRARLLPILYIRNVVGVLTAMMDRSLLLESGGFNERLRACEDFDLWMTLAERGHRFGYVPEILARYRLLASAMSFEPGRMEEGWRDVMNRRVLANAALSPRTKRAAVGYFYAFFGYRHLRHGDARVGARYLRRAVAANPLGLAGLLSAPLLVVAVARSLGAPRA